MWNLETTFCDSPKARSLSRYITSYLPECANCKNHDIKFRNMRCVNRCIRSKDTPHKSDAYRSQMKRVAQRSAAFRAPLHLHGRDARAPCLQGSILRSILQHCKLMIQQIPSVLLFPLLLLSLNLLLPSVSPTL